MEAAVRDSCNVSNAPLGGRVGSQIILQRDALTVELHTVCVSVHLVSLVCECAQNIWRHRWQSVYCVCVCDVVCVTHYLQKVEFVQMYVCEWVCECVCILGLSITMPYISPPRLSPCGSHTYIIHTLKHTLGLTGSRGMHASGQQFCAQWVWLRGSDPVLDINIKI